MDVVPFPIAAATTRSSVADQPGRWIGGLLGSIASLLVAIGVLAIGLLSGNDIEFFVIVGIVGAPVGWLLGRAALPLAREDGWARALGVGLGLGWVAPPMGGVALLIVGLLSNGVDGQTCSSMPVIGAIVLVPIVAVASYLAIVVTLPAGIVWGILVRLVPEDVIRVARVPAPVARLGTRHLLGVLAIGVAILLVAATVTTPACG